MTRYGGPPVRLMLLLAVVALLGTAAVPGGFGRAWAQQQTAETAPTALTADDYIVWDETSRRADEALDIAQASDAAFEKLRKELVAWRSRFLDASRGDAKRIKTLEAQIEVLGLPPSDGESESEELAARRMELNHQHRELSTPVVRAHEAYALANGQILQVDHLIRDRQKVDFLERGPSPLNPQNLPKELDDLHMIGRALMAEVSSPYNLRVDREKLKETLPKILLYILLSAILLLRGRKWLQTLVNSLVKHRGEEDHRIYVAAMVVSVGQLLLPMGGVILLSAALLSTSLFGPNGENLLSILPAMGGAFFAARWLGGQTFPKTSSWPATLALSARQRVRGRFYFWSLGILIALSILAKEVIALFALKTETISLVAFPIIVLSAICLAGVGRLLLASAKPTVADPDAPESSVSAERGFIGKMVHLLGRLCLFFAISGPLLAAVGYLQAALIFTLSPSMSLILLGLVTFLQRLKNEVFRMFAPPDRDGADGLLPVLFNVGFVVVSLPFFALIWGARRADLSEFWTTLRDGVQFGDARLSPTVFLIFFVVFLFGYSLTGLLKKVLGTSILPRTSLDPGAQTAMVSGVGYIGIFVTAMIAVSTAGLDLSNLAIVAGALSVGVGFGLQTIVSNFVSGLILLVERPVTEGDWIEVGGVMGTVRKISVRATTVETFDRTDIIVPNSDLISNQVTNWTRGNLNGRLILPVGVAYGTETRKVAQILQQVAEEHPLVIVNPPPLIVFQGFGADSLDFEIRVILRDINFGLGARTELNHRISERFAEEGIEVPFAQRDIWLRNPEVLLNAAEPLT